MYRCQCCKVTSKPREKVHRFVSKYRTVRYPTVVKTDGSVHKPVGREIVHELNVCGECIVGLRAGVPMSNVSRSVREAKLRKSSGTFRKKGEKRRKGTSYKRLRNGRA